MTPFTNIPISPSFTERLQVLPLESLSTRSLKFLQGLNILNIPIWRVKSLAPRNRFWGLKGIIGDNGVMGGQDPKAVLSADPEPYLDLGKKFSSPADPRPIESLQEIIKPETIFNNQGAIGPRKAQFEDLPLKKWEDQGRLKKWGGREGTLRFILCNPSNHYSRADSSPFPPHYPKLSELDRQELESGYIKDGKIMMPHLDNGNIPDHLRIKNIMYKANCSADEARAIGDLASILDSTPKMVDEFCSWAKIRGADKLLDYLYPLALGAVEAETLPKFKPNTNEWGEPARLKADKDLFNPVVADDLFISLEDVEEIQEIPNNSDEPTVKVVGSQTLWPHQIEDEEVWEAQAYDWEPEEIEPKDKGSYLCYHVLEDFGLMQSKKTEITESIRLKNGKLPEGAYE